MRKKKTLSNIFFKTCYKNINDKIEKKILLNDMFRFEKELLQIYYSFIDGISLIYKKRQKKDGGRNTTNS